MAKKFENEKELLGLPSPTLPLSRTHPCSQNDNGDIIKGSLQTLTIERNQFKTFALKLLIRLIAETDMRQMYNSAQYASLTAAQPKTYLAK